MELYYTQKAKTKDKIQGDFDVGRYDSERNADCPIHVHDVESSPDRHHIHFVFSLLSTTDSHFTGCRLNMGHGGNTT